MREWQACVTRTGKSVHLYDLDVFGRVTGEISTRCGSKVAGIFVDGLDPANLCATCTVRLTGLQARDIGVARIYEPHMRKGKRVLV
jgi:hypothetical protein